MKQMLLRWILAATCALTASCAVITVNVYFPEKDVKEAYKSLDEMLLKQHKDEAKPEPKAEGQQSSLFRFSLVSQAEAAEPQSDELAIELASMPEVSKAYEEMRGRLSQLDQLRSSGAVGESKTGQLVVRDPAKLGNGKALVDAENANRKTVIQGMGKAILKVTKQPEANLKQLMVQAAQSFAATKREQAKPGWLVENPDGTWVKK